MRDFQHRRCYNAAMLDQLTIASFQPHVGTSFWLHHEGHRIELRLTSAAKVMESEAARLPRTPFSLYFLAPLYLPQAIYHLTHDAFAEPLDIFLVPVAKEATGYTCEAVFV
jgi:hypothetical protein